METIANEMDYVKTALLFQKAVSPYSTFVEENDGRFGVDDGVMTKQGFSIKIELRFSLTFSCGLKFIFKHLQAQK